jgi:hypothetical protein
MVPWSDVFAMMGAGALRKLDPRDTLPVFKQLSQVDPGFVGAIFNNLDPVVRDRLAHLVSDHVAASLGTPQYPGWGDDDPAGVSGDPMFKNACAILASDEIDPSVLSDDFFEKTMQKSRHSTLITWGDLRKKHREIVKAIAEDRLAEGFITGIAIAGVLRV